MVAAKLRKLTPFFLKAASDEDNKIPGDIPKTQGSHIAPAADSINLRHKFLHALHIAYPGL